MQLKSFKEAGSFRKTRSVLLLLICFILIVFLLWAEAPWILFVIAFLVLMIFSSMLFWQQYAIPDLDIAEHLLLTKNILLNQITRSPLFLSIKNGEIKGDYLLLKNKPDIKVLNIDHKSAVLIEGTSNQRSLFINGVHILNKNPKIIGVFYLGIRHLQIGPHERSDLGPKNSNESLAEFHLRKETAERTKTKLFSGDFIFPSFSIFYKIAHSGEVKMESLPFQRICEKIGSSDSNLVSPEKIDEFIIFQLLKKWNTFCENKNLDEILADFPDSFELSLLNEFGIRSRITLDQIY